MRVRNGLIVATAVASFAGLTACGGGGGNNTDTPKTEKSAAAPAKPSEAPAKPVNAQPVVGTPNCEGYTPKDENDWSVPQWNGDSCRFTNDVFALMSDAGGFEGTGTYGGEVIPVVELKADDGDTDCGGATINGQQSFSSMWCGEDAGYEIIVDKAMKETADSDDGNGILSVFGKLLKDYSERRLELGGKYDRFDDTNVTCMAGAVMRTLVDKGTFTEGQAAVIGDYSFTDESKPALRDTFDEGMAGTC